jgi:hypothetical protein
MGVQVWGQELARDFLTPVQALVLVITGVIRELALGRTIMTMEAITVVVGVNWGQEEEKQGRLLEALAVGSFTESRHTAIHRRAISPASC